MNILYFLVAQKHAQRILKSVTIRKVLPSFFFFDKNRKYLKTGSNVIQKIQHGSDQHL